MTQLDLLAIGNAIVDVIAPADEAFLAEQQLDKGSMRLIDAAEATRLYGLMASGREISGGSAANTAAGAAALGIRTGFVGRVADDQLGQVFRHDIRAAGVVFDTPAGPAGNPTARSLILVTPDAQRTMNTFLGASQDLDLADLDRAVVESAGIVYLEGYLWDPAAPRAAMEQAIGWVRSAGGKLAFTLSDMFVVERHRADIRRLIGAGAIDILFANEAELLALAEIGDFDSALADIAARVQVLVTTRSEHGAVVMADGALHSVPAQPVAKVIDTTGAGDLFAGGFLAGLAQGRGWTDCATIGTIAAAEVISHYGARPEADLKALVAERLG